MPQNRFFFLLSSIISPPQTEEALKAKAKAEWDRVTTSVTQTRQAFNELLGKLAALDKLKGKV